MKIKKVTFKQILKLHLLNSRVYDHFGKIAHSSYFANFNLTQTIIDLKRALHVIYRFHQVNKKILFIGVSKKMELKINKRTVHLAVPDNFNLQGILLNSQKSFKETKARNSLSLNQEFKSLFPKMLNRPDLVVLFSHEKKQVIINESHVAKIPLIIFNAESVAEQLRTKSSYKVSSFGSDKHLFFQGLNFLFKD